MKRLAFAISMIAFLAAIPEGHCLRPSPEARTPEEASTKSEEELKEVVRERELSKLEADRRIREKEAAAAKKAETVQVRVHAPGSDPLSRNKTVLMSTTISKADLEKKNFGDLHRQVRENRLAYAGTSPSPSGPLAAAIETESPTGGTESSMTTFLILAIMGMGALYFARRDSVA